MPVLDATALIDADRPGSDVAAIVQERVDAGEDAVVPVQAAIEYCAGREDPAAGMAALRQGFWIVPCDEEIALEAARLARTAHQEAGSRDGRMYRSPPRPGTWGCPWSRGTRNTSSPSESAS